MSTTLTGVRALAGEVSARAAETEAARSVPSDLIRKIGATGAFHLFVPHSLGGPSLDATSAFEVVEELARADGSTGWTSMILNTTFFTSWLDPEVARPMLDTDRELGRPGSSRPSVTRSPTATAR